MNHIVFKNPGLIDLRALRVFGWSVKETSDPIGRFGTGSRFALATLLRTSHKVTLWRGLERYVFGVIKAEARGGATFDVVSLTAPDGSVEQLPFTTQLGKDWEVWQAFRELHSNVLDEGGLTTLLSGGFLGRNTYEPEPNTTAFLVQGAALEEAYRQRDTTFLSTPVRATSNGVDIHEGRSTNAYYRGVRVADLRAPSILTYDLRADQKLTEDRTLDTFSVDYAICQALAKCDDEEVLLRVIAAPSDSYEHNLPAYAADPSDAFVRAYQRLSQTTQMGKISAFADAVYQRAKGEAPLPPPITLNRIQQQQLDKAIAFCLDMGWKVTDYPIIVIPRMAGGLLGKATHGKIILTEELFSIGTKKLAHGLYEEWLHLSTGLCDETRAMQTHLFQQIISLGEQLRGEAL